MGLFSFIKNAGTKIFGKKDNEEKQDSPAAKKDLLKGEIQRLRIPIDNLELDMADHVIINGQTESNADREKVILALGNVEGVASVSDNIRVRNPEPESTFHEVKSGDTLSKIARDVYGDPMKYNTIFEANRPMLNDPDKIYPGQILRIPAQA